MLEGLPVVGWAEVQQRYFAWVKSKYSGRRWLSELIRKLWNVAWDLWEHRNGILHKSDTSLSSQQRRLDIVDQFLAGPGTVTADVKEFF